MGSEMVDEEVDIAVARKLGWTIKSNEWWVDENGNNSTSKDYCHDIKAAWEIVEHLVSHGIWDVSIKGRDRQNSDWCVTLTDNGNQEHADADTAPMAICLASLKLQ